VLFSEPTQLKPGTRQTAALASTIVKFLGTTLPGNESYSLIPTFCPNYASNEKITSRKHFAFHLDYYKYVDLRFEGFLVTIAAVVASRSAMSNPRPVGRMRPSRRFCAAQFRFWL